MFNLSDHSPPTSLVIISFPTCIFNALLICLSDRVKGEWWRRGRKRKGAWMHYSCFWVEDSLGVSMFLPSQPPKPHNALLHFRASTLGTSGLCLSVDPTLCISHLHVNKNKSEEQSINDKLLWAGPFSSHLKYTALTHYIGVCIDGENWIYGYTMPFKYQKNEPISFCNSLNLS